MNIEQFTSGLILGSLIVLAVTLSIFFVGIKGVLILCGSILLSLLLTGVVDALFSPSESEDSDDYDRYDNVVLVYYHNGYPDSFPELIGVCWDDERAEEIIFEHQNSCDSSLEFEDEAQWWMETWPIN